MRNFLASMIFLFLLLLLTACGGVKTKTVDLVDYLDVSFEGMSTKGVADYYLDIDQAVLDVYGWEEEDFEKNYMELFDKKPEETIKIDALFSQYQVDLEPTENLANGDKVNVTITVDEEADFAFKDGKKEFTVEGLEEPEVLTSEEVKKHVVVDFVGADERGNARINNTFSGSLNQVSFAIENDGELKNGTEAKLILDPEYENSLINIGYQLEDNFNVTYEVKDLIHFPESTKDIKNLKDINRKLDEDMNKDFPEKRSYDFETRYKVKEEKTLYRRFIDSDDSYYNDIENNGSYIKLYTIKRYNNKSSYDDDEPESTYVLARGYSNIQLDENGQVNITQLKQFRESHDESYSLETVQQTYEGYGFELVKGK